MKNKNIPLYRSVVSLFFIIWGIIWLLFLKTEILGKVISGFFIIFGITFFLYSIREISKYKKTGDVKIRIDERAKINNLKASRNAFEFIYISLAILIAFWGSGVIDEHIFAALTGPILAIGIVTYLLAYHIYEIKGQE